MVLNERNLFELGHKWGKLLLRFGTQDLERHFSAQVPSNGRQTPGLTVIRHGFVEQPSAPLTSAFPLHAVMIPTLSPPLFIDNTTQLVQRQTIFI